MKIHIKKSIAFFAFAFASFLGCSRDITTGVLGAKPTASFTVTNVANAYNTYLSQSTSTNTFNWQWQDGSSALVTGMDTFRTYYPEAGSYKVHLLALGSGGYDTVSQIIQVASDDPTVFLPGYDGSKLYLTDPDNNVFFASQKIRWMKPDSTQSIINVDNAESYQTMDGFGFTLTGGSAQLLTNMDATTRTSTLQRLFGLDSNNIGISYLRLSIGASDLNDHVFSYDDMPSGQTDPTLANFNLGPDANTIVPVLKEILTINPNIKIMGSPWSAPTWMKNNGSAIAGSLLPEYYTTYANYFVKYINTMKNAGIVIDAITPQNEPQNANNNPSMLMQSSEEAAFVKVLGPALQQAGLSTKIIVWDHNADNAAYPIAILNDAQAAHFVDGSAFHLYAGDISALSQVHNAYPEKNLYFTEQWVGAPSNLKGDLGWHVENLIIGAPRNWSKNVLEWNLASDPNQNPHTSGGCSNCLGALTSLYAGPLPLKSRPLTTQLSATRGTKLNIS